MTGWPKVLEVFIFLHLLSAFSLSARMVERKSMPLMNPISSSTPAEAVRIRGGERKKLDQRRTFLSNPPADELSESFLLKFLSDSQQRAHLLKAGCERNLLWLGDALSRSLQPSAHRSAGC